MLRLIDRSKPKGEPQTFATVATFIVSSIWHGTYPGYILCFVTLAFLEIQSKHFHRLKLASFLKRIFHPLVLDIGLRVWLHYSVSYSGMALVFLKYSDFNRMHSNLGYIMHALIPIVTLMTLYLPKDRIPKAKE